jgi:predicted transcriptional regulator
MGSTFIHPHSTDANRLLRQAGSSRAAVAALMGVTPQALTNYMSGRRRPPADLPDALEASVGPDLATQIVATIPDTGTQGGQAILRLLDAGLMLAALAEELGVACSTVRLYLDGVRPVPAAMPAALTRLSSLEVAGRILAAVPGFRGRSWRVTWVLDADIRDYFTSLDRSWLVRFLEHRIAGRRVLCLIQKWLSAGVIRERGLDRQ